MPLRLEFLQEGDFQALEKFKHSQDGDLAAPAADAFCPVDTDEDAHQRNKWSVGQQLDLYRLDYTAMWLKVVDTDQNNSIISLGRWHFYPNEYLVSTLEIAGLKNPDAASSWPKDMNVALYRAVLDKIFSSRNTWMARGPKWVLTTLKTREPCRRKGAGTMIVQWGIEQARKMNCPAYIEASAEATSMYKKCGFQECGEMTTDLRPFGIEADMNIARLVWRLGD